MIKIVLKKKKQGSCPKETQDLELNTKNRNASIKADHIQYGPLNLSDEDYWVRAAKHWNTTPEVAKKSNPARRKSFRARHNCDNPGPKTKARYWSCRKW